VAPLSELPTYSAAEFEQDVEELLERLFPFAVLSGLRLFSAVNRLSYELGIEIDNLLHFRIDRTDLIVVVEAKNQEIKVEPKGRWTAQYPEGPKDVRQQVDVHIRMLWEYLEPLARGTDLRFAAIVCSASPKTPERKADGFHAAALHLSPIHELPATLSKLLKPEEPGNEVMRVSQSGFLDILRLGLAVPELGHPELSSAIRYVERCRRALDENLFEDFSPTRERWAINGSAGMGKSVLLAYTAAVLSCGFVLARDPVGMTVVPADKMLAEIGINGQHSGSAVGVMAMTDKQLENLRVWYEFFQARFHQYDQAGRVRFRRPEFDVCRDRIKIATLAGRCHALLVDEAHDLPAFAAQEIAQQHAARKFYLVVACDRHQKLKLAGPNARIIEGVDFSNRSKRLKQIYRSPAPVYIASLALMFRWFGDPSDTISPVALPPGSFHRLARPRLQIIEKRL